MSCEMRSMMTSYFFGSSMRTPPTCTNSADTPSTSMELILSTRAGGNVFSIPKTIPIFFMANSFNFLCQTPHVLLRRSAGSSGPNLRCALTSEPLSECIDNSSRSSQHSPPLRPGLAVHFKLSQCGGFQKLRQEFTHDRLVHMGQHRLRIRVGLEQPARFAIFTQKPFVSQGSRFLFRSVDHRLRGLLEGREFPLMDVEVQFEVHLFSSHGDSD